LYLLRYKRLGVLSAVLTLKNSNNDEEEENGFTDVTSTEVSEQLKVRNFVTITTDHNYQRIIQVIVIY